LHKQLSQKFTTGFAQNYNKEVVKYFKMTPKAKSKLKPGLTVKIKNWEEIKTTLTSLDKHGNALHNHHPLGWFKPMKKFCGKKFTLLQPYNEDPKIWVFQGNDFIWHKHWFTLL